MSSLLTFSGNPLDPFYTPPRPKLDVHLDQQDGESVPTFTTLDTISGHATLSTDSDLPFKSVEISFMGTSRTMVDQPGIAQPAVGRSSAFQTFLRLVQPIEDDEYPHPRVLEGGRTYTFPFTFVVPERLLPDVCNHSVNHPQVSANHIHLPPSLGDPTVAGTGSALLDDMSPETMQIQYAVRAKLLKATEDKPRTVIDKAKKVRIVPASEEQPPLEVTDDSMEYCMRKEKDVKKGALRKKTGRLVMAAAQPRAFRLPKINRSSKSTSDQDFPATTATVHLRFDPVDEKEQPPRLGTLWSKLKADTWYSTEAWADIPEKTASTRWRIDRGSHPQTVCLASRCVESATWKKHTASTPESSRRSSMQSDSSAASAASDYYTSTASYTGSTYYTTSVLVPVTLPKTKAYVPTFHSCLASRTYALDLSLSYHTSSTSFSPPHVSVRVPVQIMGPGHLADASQVLASSVRHADEFFTPRTIRAPQPEYTERARLQSVAAGTVIEEEEGEADSGSAIGRDLGLERTTTLASVASSRAASQRTAPPPDYFMRQMSNRRIVRTNC